MSDGTATTTTDLDVRLEKHRVELTGYCYRMLGSSFEAEDAVQDTMVRAWRSYDKFEGRSSLRSWLYRIATNVCLDMLTAGNKRARPMDLTESTPLAQAALSPRPDHTWLEPAPDSRVLPTTDDPAEAAVAKESVRLAFMAALQQLPPKQRAVLILREVLAWKASEVAELLGTSVASVNSALQRARATLAEQRRPGADAAVSDPLDEEQQKLLDRYVAAFEGYDMTALTALLHEDAIMTMPPFDLWLTGAGDITGFMTTMGAPCAGSRLVPVQVNGLPGFAQYKPDPEAGGFTPWAVQVLEISGGRITGFHCFLDTKRWFPLFGLPLHLEAEADEVEQGV
ncbi:MULTISPECIES: sigma-70 family RNA polymerase sigma factor [Streptomyces]|uniref:sigma-70 family RNA polymerase sigma factor n=1 Tax=Streptomyces TaxID=1883 RepID=UPI000D529B36|nr:MULTISPECIES: sigma-70 family RNA polymerase sigma factor [Streptomyces]AWE52065.1 RNA polymerase subunit sigma-70 [Streptomyces nigra]MCF2538554.1 sigma-70 family RNA polymerase sigma factor [Streptomyces sp. FB2]